MFLDPFSGAVWAARTLGRGPYTRARPLPGRTPPKGLDTPLAVTLLCQDSDIVISFIIMIASVQNPGQEEEDEKALQGVCAGCSGCSLKTCTGRRPSPSAAVDVVVFISRVAKGTDNPVGSR